MGHFEPKQAEMALKQPVLPPERSPGTPGSGPGTPDLAPGPRIWPSDLALGPPKTSTFARVSPRFSELLGYFALPLFLGNPGFARDRDSRRHTQCF